MLRNKLGNSNLSVSPIGLGAQFWDGDQDKDEAFRQLDYCVDHGINLIDTAEIYPVPYSESTWGNSERLIGLWLEKTKSRDKIVIATKVAGRSDEFPYIRNGDLKLDKHNIVQAVDGSLARLKSSYIDLLQIHWPNRETNYFGQLGYQHTEDAEDVPIEETLEALQALVTSGKVREIGVCNETAWGLMRYLSLAKESQYPRIVSNQSPYNLLNRTFETAQAEMAMREEFSLIGYSPLAHGALTGKYRNGDVPKGSRYEKYPFFRRYKDVRAVEASDAYVDLAYKYDLDPAQAAIAFLLTRPFVASVLVSVSNVKQLQSNIESAALSLPAEYIDDVEAYHCSNPNPAT